MSICEVFAKLLWLVKIIMIMMVNADNIDSVAFWNSIEKVMH